MHSNLAKDILFVCCKRLGSMSGLLDRCLKRITSFSGLVCVPFRRLVLEASNIIYKAKVTLFIVGTQWHSGLMMLELPAGCKTG